MARLVVRGSLAGEMVRLRLRDLSVPSISVTLSSLSLAPLDERLE